MRFVTHEAAPIDITGTFKQGVIGMSYAMLNQAFGPPNTTPNDDCVDAEWHIQFEDGLVATIYNWKNGPRWLGRTGPNVDQITRWVIGGKNYEAVERVLSILQSKSLLVPSRYERILNPMIPRQSSVGIV